MTKNKNRKLNLSTETIRTLDEVSLASVKGGAAPTVVCITSRNCFTMNNNC